MKYFLIPLLLISLFGLAFATEPKVFIMEHYMPEVELLPDTQIKYGEIFTIHAWLPTYENKPDSLGYFVDVLDEEENQIDSTLWFAKEDFVYEFDTTHPAYNITKGGTYFINIERADEMQRTGVMEKPLEFEIIKQTCRSDLFLAFRADGTRTACVKPYTLDKLIERGWAKAHTDMGSLDVKPIKDAKIMHCPKDSRLIQGGYYVTNDSTLTVSQKRFDHNGWMVEFTNPEEYTQHAYVFVDCITDSPESEVDVYSGWIAGEDYCSEWCDQKELYSIGCDNPILAHLIKYSNLLDEEFDGVYAIEEIGLPDGVSQEKFEECVDFIYEKRLSDVTVLDCNIPDNPHKEYQCFREAFSNCQLAKVDPDIYTIEGSPIYTNVTITNDCKIYGIIDTTTDVHGDRGIIKTSCETLTDDQYGWNIKDCDAINYPEMQFNFEMQLYHQILECEKNGNTWVREKLECVEE